MLKSKQWFKSKPKTLAATVNTTLASTEKKASVEKKSEFSRPRPARFNYTVHQDEVVDGRIVRRRPSFCEYKNEFWQKNQALGEGSFGSAYLFIKVPEAPQLADIKAGEEEARLLGTKAIREAQAKLLQDDNVIKAVIKQAISATEMDLNDNIDLARESVFSKIILGEGAFCGDLRAKGSNIYVFMPFVKGTLAYEYRFQTATEFLEVCRTILTTVDQEIHAKSIVHGDIKGNNFFIIKNTTGYKIVFIDYTFTRFKDSPTFEKEDVPLNVHVAPELRTTSRPAQFNQDVYSLGKEFKCFQNETAIMLKSFHLIDEAFTDLVGKMTVDAAANRITIAAALELVTAMQNRLRDPVYLVDNQEAIASGKLIPNAEIVKRCKEVVTHQDFMKFFNEFIPMNRLAILNLFGMDFLKSKIDSYETLMNFFAILPSFGEYRLKFLLSFAEADLRLWLGTEINAREFATYLDRQDRVTFLAHCYKRVGYFMVDNFPDERDIPELNITGIRTLFNNLQWLEIFIEKVKPENRLKMLFLLGTDFLTARIRTISIPLIKLIPAENRQAFIQWLPSYIIRYSFRFDDFCLLLAELSAQEKMEAVKLVGGEYLRNSMGSDYSRLLILINLCLKNTMELLSDHCLGLSHVKLVVDDNLKNLNIILKAIPETERKLFMARLGGEDYLKRFLPLPSGEWSSFGEFVSLLPIAYRQEVLSSVGAKSLQQMMPTPQDIRSFVLESKRDVRGDKLELKAMPRPEKRLFSILMHTYFENCATIVEALNVIQPFKSDRGLYKAMVFELNDHYYVKRSRLGWYTGWRVGASKSEKTLASDLLSKCEQNTNPVEVKGLLSKNLGLFGALRKGKLGKIAKHALEPDIIAAESWRAKLR